MPVHVDEADAPLLPDPLPQVIYPLVGLPEGHDVEPVAPLGQPQPPQFPVAQVGRNDDGTVPLRQDPIQDTVPLLPADEGKEPLAPAAHHEHDVGPVAGALVVGGEHQPLHVAPAGHGPQVRTHPSPGPGNGQVEDQPRQKGEGRMDRPGDQQGEQVDKEQVYPVVQRHVSARHAGVPASVKFHPNPWLSGSTDSDSRCISGLRPWGASPARRRTPAPRQGRRTRRNAGRSRPCCPPGR